MSIYSWKQLALWSLEYSCLSEPEKTQGKAILLDRWEKFCKQVVKEYDSILTGDGIDEKELAKFYARR
jgi:adenosine deaminase CECR1